jgi:hypothetical protein
VLCSLHQVDLVRGLADRVLGLRGGRLITDSAIENFLILSDSAIYSASLDGAASGEGAAWEPRLQPGSSQDDYLTPCPVFLHIPVRFDDLV